MSLKRSFNEKGWELLRITGAHYLLNSIKVHLTCILHVGLLLGGLRVSLAACIHRPVCLTALNNVCLFTLKF